MNAFWLQWFILVLYIFSLGSAMKTNEDHSNTGAALRLMGRWGSRSPLVYGQQHGPKSQGEPLSITTPKSYVFVAAERKRNIRTIKHLFLFYPPLLVCYFSLVLRNISIIDRAFPYIPFSTNERGKTMPKWLEGAAKIKPEPKGSTVACFYLIKEIKRFVKHPKRTIHVSHLTY